MSDERREQRPTAYVLGEMPPEERAAFEAEMAGDPSLRAEVEDIRAMADLLSTEMSAGQARLPAGMRERIEAAAAAKEAGGAGEKAGRAAQRAEEKGASEEGIPEKEAPEKRSSEKGSPEKAAPSVVALRPRKPVLRRASFWLAAAAVLAAAPALLLTARSRSPAHDDAVAAAPVPMATAAATAWAAAPSGQQQADIPALGGDVLVTATPAGVVAGEKRDEEGRARGSDRFEPVPENPFLTPVQQPLSTFSIDVDTASYAMVRSQLTSGQMPPAAAVRIEEMVNYFDYAYPEPEGDVPFRVQLDVGAAPWAPDHKLVRVAMKGKTVKLSAVDGVNLVFLVDTSGSMSDANKLPLLKQGFRMLVDKLRPDDRVAIVAYAGSAGLVLPSTPVRERETVLGALDRLSSGGSTNGGAGIGLAYQVAAENYVKGGVNRVLLATDGDFNVGVTGDDALVSLVQEKAKTGVFLTVLGFGRGNFNDAMLEKIADKGNGQYAYIDSEVEAKRALVDGLGGLVTIAKDVKLQVEWNPALVSGYRLIGYENRTMAAEDFHDDRKDAGELGSGHTVTALYEITQHPSAGSVAPAGSGLKYQAPAVTAAPTPAAASGELLTVKLRYKEPDASESKLLEQSLRDAPVSVAQMSPDFRFAAAVASFGMLLRKSSHAGSATYDTVLDLAEPAAGDDARRRELLGLVRKARDLSR